MIETIKKIPNPEEIIDLWVSICNHAFTQSVDTNGSLELLDVQVNEEGPANYVKSTSHFLKIERKNRGGFVVATGDDGFGSDQALQTAGKEPTNLFPVFIEEVQRAAQQAFGDLLTCTEAMAGMGRPAVMKEEGLGYFLTLCATTSGKNKYNTEFYFSPELCFMLEEESKPPAKTSEAAKKAASSPPASQPTAPPPPHSRYDPPAAPGYAKNIDRIMDVDLNITISFGRTRMLLKEIMQLGTGSIIELDRTAEDPVDVWVNNKRVARGEVVIVGGNYGVRITEIEDVVERINTLRT